MRLVKNDTAKEPILKRSKYSLLELFMSFSSLYGIAELDVNDLHQTVYLMKQLEKYNILLDDYDFDELQLSPDLTNDIFVLALNNKLLSLDRGNMIYFTMTEADRTEIVNNTDLKTKKLMLEFIDDYVKTTMTFNTSRNAQLAYINNFHLQK